MHTIFCRLFCFILQVPLIKRLFMPHKSLEILAARCRAFFRGDENLVFRLSIVACHFFLFVLLSAILAACASQTKSTVTHNNIVQIDDPAQAQLAEAATSVSKSLNHLDEIQEAVTPPPPHYTPPDPAAYGMNNLVTIDWSGPIEPLLEQIAEASAYTVRVLGVEPAIPVMVYLDKTNRPLGEILRDAGYQCGQKADIVVYPKTKIIELRYAANDK